MDVKEAIEILTEERDTVIAGLLREAYDMAIVALQMQDGNLHLDSVNGSFQIGTINGNVTMRT